MRVATRRMRTAFDIFASACEPKVMKHFLKGLKRVGGVLGGVRDLDVILENAVNYQEKLKESQRAGLEPLLSAWKHVIDKKRSKMTRHLQSEAYQQFKHDFNVFLQAPENINGPAPSDSVMNVRIRDVVPMLQPASNKPLVLRQVPIWENDIVTGFIDLALERAFVYREHAPS